MGLLRVRKELLVFLTHKIALQVLKLMRKPNEFTYTMESLASLPAESLGHDLYVFLMERNLALLNHYVRHDLKHVLLGYDTTEEGEACLQSFMMGNGRISFPVIATVLYSIITMPEYRRKMRNAYAEGKRCLPVHGWPWNDLMVQPTVELRKRFRCETDKK